MTILISTSKEENVTKLHQEWRRHNKRTLSYKYTNKDQDSHQTTTRPITSNPINLKNNNIKALQSI